MKRHVILPGNVLGYSLVEFESPTNSIVVLGANGAGKTRFGSRIEELNGDLVHRISAQKSLVMPKSINTMALADAILEFSYGPGSVHNKGNMEWLKTVGRLNQRYSNNPNTHLLNDFSSVMTLLFTDEFETSLQFRENYRKQQTLDDIQSKLDIVIGIWSKLLPHRNLSKNSNSLNVNFRQGEYYTSVYNGSEMSDGERVILYLIGVSLSVKKESILIIDEPELHIHKSILKTLFDEIEKARPDILFIYLTHDIDFAVSRTGSTKIWLKSYGDNYAWKYELLIENDIPEQIYLEILGSRKPILFIEGEKTSIDYELYTPLFDNYTVKPIGGCSQVVESTKSFNNLRTTHHLSATGIIDRDRRTDAEVLASEKHDIHVLKVAEIENIFLIEEVVKTIAKKLYKDPNHVFEEVKKSIIKAFEEEIESQIMEHTNHRLKLVFNNAISAGNKDWQSLESQLNVWFNMDSFKTVYEEIKAEFNQYLNNKDYYSILKVSNIKGLISKSKLATLCDLHDKKGVIKNLVISILKEGSDESEHIKSAMKSVIF